MTDRTDAVIVRWVPEHGPPRRYRFEPTHDGEHERVEEQWNGCRWRPIGRERVSGLAVEDA